MLDFCKIVRDKKQNYEGDKKLPQNFAGNNYF